MFCKIKSIVFKIRILTCLLLCRSYRVRSRTNEDTCEANMLLRQNGASNDSSKKFRSGYRPSENRYGHDNDVQVSKRRITNKIS